jgi:hypothetical protein
MVCNNYSRTYYTICGIWVWHSKILLLNVTLSASTPIDSGLDNSASEIASETMNPADKWLDSYNVPLQRNALTCTRHQQKFGSKTKIGSRVGYHYPHYLSPCPSFTPLHFLFSFFLILSLKFFPSFFVSSVFICSFWLMAIKLSIYGRIN